LRRKTCKRPATRHRTESRNHRPQLGEFTDLETIRQIVLVRGESGARIGVADVATVEDSLEECASSPGSLAGPP
jgi:multidrug efflux pump subunit AcrB